MARNMYGATSADFTITSGGRVIPGAVLTLWTARTGGTKITDLLDVDSVACTTVTSAADGSVVYYGPNNDKTVHWADSGQGSRIAIRPVDITGDPPVLSIGTVTTGAAAANLTGTSESPVLNLTLPTAGANGVDTAAIQDSAVTSAKIAANAVTDDKIAANAVGSSELADNAVDTAAIADGAATPAKLATTGRFVFPTGAANGYGFASGAVHLSGTGTPEGVVTAAPGSTWLQTDATTDVKGWIRWIKATGTGNTGWIAGPEADTGWRNVLAWAGDAFTVTPLGTPHADWTCTGAGVLYIRRIGNEKVQYYCSGTLKSPTTGGGQSLLPNLPSAFTGLGSFAVAISGGFALALTPEMSRAGNTDWVTNAYLPSSWSAELPLGLPSAWPSSLPGS